MLAGTINARYFVDSSGNPVFLAGSNLGWELQDNAWDTVATFDYPSYLELLGRQGHNFLRLWMVEHSRSAQGPPEAFAHPLPFARSRRSEGMALDGRPKFDLRRFDEAYFTRLRERVRMAAERGIYVAVMLFQGWSVRRRPDSDPWFGHPFNPMNNVNGVDGDPRSNGGATTQSIAAPERIKELQRRYVRHVIEAVSDQENVLYEICNEQATLIREGPQPLAAVEWAYDMVRFIQDVESELQVRHPVGLSGYGANSDWLFAEGNPADWIAPSGGRYYEDPPPADGERVVILDTDHIRPLGDDHARWLWKSFTRGMNLSLLDYSLRPADAPGPSPIPIAEWTLIQQMMGDIAELAATIDVSSLTPQGGLVSSGYCLAQRNTRYICYMPDTDARQLTLDLTQSDADRVFRVEWLAPRDRRWIAGGTVRGGAVRTLDKPGGMADAVAHVAV